jgi:hypothetical protein
MIGILKQLINHKICKYSVELYLKRMQPSEIKCLSVAVNNIKILRMLLPANAKHQITPVVFQQLLFYLLS